MKTEVEKKDFTQLCVWYGCTLGNATPKDFEEFMAKEFDGVRVKFAESVVTLPDVDKERGKVVEGTGGRNDLFFYVHSEDTGKFAVPRLKAGIRWWEDVLMNGNEHLYPDMILRKYPRTW